MVKLRLKRDVEEPVAPPAGPPKGVGVLTEWNDERGFGFITPEDGSPKVFLHIKALTRAARRPSAGELFFYQLGADERGRPRAEDAFQTGLGQKRAPPSMYGFCRWLSRRWIIGLAVPLLAAVFCAHVVPALAIAYLLNSLLTIMFYKTDKFLARYKYWRIEERDLHVWGLLFGWPGALLAQKQYHHKSSKVKFQVVCWLCVVLNCAGTGFALKAVGIQNLNVMARQCRHLIQGKN